MSSAKKHFDIIIAGAGCAGLSAAWHLTRYPILAKKKILLIDRTFEPRDDRTWCFWSMDSVPDPVPVYRKWEKMEVRVLQERMTGEIRETPYYCVKSAPYSAEMQKALEGSGVEFLEGDVLEIKAGNEKAVVKTSSGDFTAGLVIDTIPPNHKQEGELSLLQHFAGWEIETEEPVFDPSTIRFMDFDIPQKAGATFIYVLPYSENKALIEYTLFSDQLLEKEEYAKGIEDYIRDRYPGQMYKVERKEFGVIPMAPGIYDQPENAHVIRLGQAAGMPKASTGYTFSRIHWLAAKLARDLSDGKRPDLSNPSRLRYRLYDILLLDIIHNQPDQILPVFYHFFKLNRFEMLLRFLDEKTSFTEDLFIMSTVPFAPFIKAIKDRKNLLLREL